MSPAPHQRVEAGVARMRGYHNHEDTDYNENNADTFMVATIKLELFNLVSTLVPEIRIVSVEYFATAGVGECVRKVFSFNMIPQGRRIFSCVEAYLTHELSRFLFRKELVKILKSSKFSRS